MSGRAKANIDGSSRLDNRYYSDSGSGLLLPKIINCARGEILQSEKH